MPQGLTLNELTATTFVNQSDLLMIYQTGSTLSISVNNLTKNIVNTNFTGNTLFITGKASVGAGTTTPTQTFRVSGNTFLEGILFVGNNSNTSGISNARFNNPINLAGTSTSVFHTPTVGTGVTSVYGIRSQTILSSNAALNFYNHFSVADGSIGVGATINQNVAYSVGSDFNNGNSNIGFFGEIVSGSNNWNIYMAGNAPNYIAGRIGFGSTSIQNINLRLARVIDGGTSAYGLYQGGFVQPGVQAGYGYNNHLNAASTSDLSNYYHFNAVNGTVNTITGTFRTHGYYAHSNMVYTGATNNYGFYGNLSSGLTATQNWNLYMNGTAPNYLNGELRIGTTSSSGNKLYVTSDSDPVRFGGLQSNTGATKNVIADNNGVLYVENKPKKYVALLTQTGTNAPTAIVLENTLGTVTFGYNTTGIYSVTATGLLTSNKTTIVTGGAVCSVDSLTTNGFLLLSYSVPTIANGILNKSTIEITVYP
jgi:hypothetical protein